MKTSRVLSICTVLLCLTCACHAYAQSSDEFNTVCSLKSAKGESPYHGITYYALSEHHNHGKLDSSSCKTNKITHPVYIIKVDLQAKGVEALVRPEPADFKGITTPNFASKYDLAGAINTGFGSTASKWLAGCPKSSKRSAIGYHKSQGKDYSCYAQLSDFPIVGLDKYNRVRRIEPEQLGKTIESELKATMHHALSSYVFTLVKDGEVVDNSKTDHTNEWLAANNEGGGSTKHLRTNPHPRTAIGVDKTGRYFFMVVVDGRRSNMTGMTIEELSYCMRNMGAHYAYNLDGGGSSTITIGNKVQNLPSDGTECGNYGECTNKSCSTKSSLRAQYLHLGFKAQKTCTPSQEICNNIDDDCNDLVDENGVCDAEDPVYQAMLYNPQNTDVDGDGKADICARGKAGIFCAFSQNLKDYGKDPLLDLSDANGWDKVSQYATLLFADINGDDKADICARDNQGIKCWFSTGKGFGEPTAAIPMTDADGYDNVMYYSTIRAADINGDGKADICARFKDGFKCYPWNDGTWGTEITLSDMSDEQNWNSLEYYSTIRTADINGDGKSDVCGRSKTGFHCWLSDGTQFKEDFSAPDWSDENGWNKPEYYLTIRMPDINGDHKADLCARNKDGIICHLSEGDKFGEAIQGPDLTDDQNWNDYDNYSTIQFGDINGDGMDDLCMRGNHEMRCYLSEGNSFGTLLKIPEMGDNYGWNNPDHFRTIRLADINGDKKSEICGRFSTGIKCFQYTGTEFSVIEGPEFPNSHSWDQPPYYSTIRIGGPLFKTCSLQKEICSDGIDNNCNGQTDETDGCIPLPPQEECKGTIDENGKCIEDTQTPECKGTIDENGKCIEDTQTPECKGTIDENGKCIEDKQTPECKGTIDENGKCIEDKQKPEEECEGTIDENGKCIEDKQKPEEECEGTIDENGQCQLNSEDAKADSDCSCSIKNQNTSGHAFGITGLIILGLFGISVRRRKYRV
ncbi:MAG: VCBS repeat-containing protein [Proteobacteria bacterium]|nr:VCBS repeat-containing protein [Pseudomonadota bacterium]